LIKRKPTRKDLAHPPLHLTNQHPPGRVQARRRGLAADLITEKQEKNLSQKINLQKWKKMLRSGDAMRLRRLEIKKTETTRKRTQEALETRRRIIRQRRNLADQLVDQRTSISSLVRRRGQKIVKTR
jgi:hypothetical protein